MTLSERLAFCRECGHVYFDKNRGLVCGLTDEKPDFDVECGNFEHEKEMAQKPIPQETPHGELYEAIRERFKYELPISGGDGTNRENAIKILEADSISLPQCIISYILIMGFNTFKPWWIISEQLITEGKKTYYIPHVICFNTDNNGDVNLEDVIAEEDFYFDVTIPIKEGDVFEINPIKGSGILYEQIRERLKYEIPITGGDGHDSENAIEVLEYEMEKRDELKRNVIYWVGELKYKSYNFSYTFSKKACGNCDVFEVSYYQLNWRNQIDETKPLGTCTLYFVA